MQFDTLRFLTDNFTDAAGLVHRANSYGVKNLDNSTVYKWFVRKQVPAKWLPVLFAIVELEEGSISIAPYMGVAR